MNIKYVLTLLGITLMQTMMIAQPGYVSKETRERIESQRIAFITQRLALTPEEATQFWPIYNEYKNALKDMRDELERPDLETISDQEAERVIEQHLKQEQQKSDLKRNLFTRLKPIVGARRVLLLQKAEMEFNRELLRRVQEQRKP
jgi:hypothetical protein